MADRDAPDAGLLIDGARVPAAAGERAPVRELGPSALEHYSEQKSVFISDE